MGILNDVLASDAEFFVDTDNFGEQITFTPRNGVARNINAVVIRNPEGEEVIIVEARNHATLGISLTETGFIGGTLAVPVKLGEAAKNFTIEHPNPIEQDAGMVRIALNRMR